MLYPHRLTYCFWNVVCYSYKSEVFRSGSDTMVKPDFLRHYKLLNFFWRFSNKNGSNICFPFQRAFLKSNDDCAITKMLLRSRTNPIFSFFSFLGEKMRERKTIFEKGYFWYFLCAIMMIWITIFLNEEIFFFLRKMWRFTFFHNFAANVW